MKLIFTCLLLLTSLSSIAFKGKVVSIADGDTITVLTPNNQQVKIRLSGIDTPEKSQAFGTTAKQTLSSKIFGKTIEVKDHGQDRYGRTIGDIYLGKRWINLEMVKEGYAWHYKQYSKDQKLAEAELEARRALKGLWVDSSPIPPWKYRKGTKSASSKASGKSKDKAITGYWLNTSSGSRHNSNCRYYENTSKGRSCGKKEGKPCGICGG